jgi:hypothetical protein
MNTKNNSPLVINYDYEGNPVGFTMDGTKEGAIMVNATQMAKSFNKRVPEWTRLQSTIEFLDELWTIRKGGYFVVQKMHYEIEQTNDEGLNHILKRFDSDIHLIVTTNGGKIQGTWMHEDVALEFARWLSPKFAIWCNDRIKELLTTGSVKMSDHPVVNNYMRHYKRAAFEYTKSSRVNPTVHTVRAQLTQKEPEVYELLRMFCEKKRLPIRNVITIAIEEKIYRDMNPDGFNHEALMQERERNRQEIDYLNRLLEEKEKAYQEKVEMKIEMKQQEIMYLNQIIAAKEQAIAILMESRKGGES